MHRAQKGRYAHHSRRKGLERSCKAMADTADLLGDRLKVAAVVTARLLVEERLLAVAVTGRLLVERLPKVVVAATVRLLVERLPKVAVVAMVRLLVAERPLKVAVVATAHPPRAERLADTARPPHRAAMAPLSSKGIHLKARWFLLEPAAR